MKSLRLTRRRALLVALLALVVIGGALVAWLASPTGVPMPAAMAALESDGRVSVTLAPWIAFEPVGKAPASGFIFYPGGRVMPEAYAPLARALAEHGYLAVIVPMPLNFAILDPGAASDVMAANPAIERWVIGGHSLGGVMAARFAGDNIDRVDGLVLLAAYLEAQIELSGSRLAVATVYGDRDGLVSLDEAEGALERLPAGAHALRIAGGNHAQFGWYGEQSGDWSASISREEQQAQVLAAILRIMREAGK